MGNNKLQLCDWDSIETCTFYFDKPVLGYLVWIVMVIWGWVFTLNEVHVTL